MFNIVESPWLLLSLSLVSLAAVTMFRKEWSNRARWKELAVPVILAALAIGLDYFIRTDTEKILATIKRSMKFAIDMDFNEFEKIFSPDYSDPFHPTREKLENFCRFSQAMADVEKLNMRHRPILKIDGDSAKCFLDFMVRLSSSTGSMAGTKSLFFVEVEVELEKMQDNSWMINRADLLTVNDNKFNWGAVP